MIFLRDYILDIQWEVKGYYLIMASPRNGVTDTSVNGGSKDNEIDREKVCPLLLRVFCANSRHNNLSDYNRGT